MAAATTVSGHAFSRLFQWAGYLTGLALGGFFDGILLHQILQWHHLLSALEGEAFRDIRVQILADGAFHALMYVVALIALWMLWRARPEFGAPSANRFLFANVIIGFGAWHVADALFSHWILGIHRIRMETSAPLMWDVAWLVAFGLIPAVVGAVLRRRGKSGSHTGRAAACVLAAMLAGGGGLASLPPRGVSQVMVYFLPGTPAKAVFAAAEAVDGRIIWSDGSGQLWAFDLADPRRAGALYGHGALFVGNTMFPVGCLAWSRA